MTFLKPGKPILALAVLGALFLPGSTFIPRAAENSAPIASPSQSEAIDEQPLRLLLPKALSGDIDAAVRVAGHFQAVGSVEEGEYWTTIAAENGAVVEMLNLSMLLVIRRDVQDGAVRCRRARFWYDRALATARRRESRRLKVREGRAEMYERVEECLTALGASGDANRQR